MLPATVAPVETGYQTCYRHPDQQAGVICQRCDRPICPHCMNQASVGFHCPECTKKGAQKVYQGVGSLYRRPLVTEVLMALNVAVFVIAVAGWIAVHAIVAIVTPHQGPHWATLPLLAGIVGVKVWFSRRMHRAGDRTGSTALSVEALHHYSDAITSAAAFIGISIAVWGGRGYETADDWAALLACVVIAFNGGAMFTRAIGDVMDLAVPEAFEQEIRERALAVPGVGALDKCRVRKSGLSHLVDIQVRVDGNLSVREGHQIAHAVKDALLASPLHVSDVTVHIEPMV